MRIVGTNLTMSASDLSHFLACRYRTALDLSVIYEGRPAPSWVDPAMALLQERGIIHERQYVNALESQGLRTIDFTIIYLTRVITSCQTANHEDWRFDGLFPGLAISFNFFNIGLGNNRFANSSVVISLAFFFGLGIRSTPMARKITGSMNLVELMTQFPDEEKCRATLEELRWPDGVSCPRCNTPKVYRMNTRAQFYCELCTYQFSVTSGTIFHDTHLPLRKWLIAIYLIVDSKKGFSANQMRRTLGVSYKTAWYLCHRIRAAMTEHDPALLNGTVECDETYVGGRLRGKGTGIGNYIANKAVVIGIIQRGGKVRLQVIDKCNRKTLHGFIKKHAAPDTEVIITDELPAYKGIGDHDTVHQTVNHMKKEWVRGNVHTNSIENVWSLLKRSVTGTYHKLSMKHMDAYLDELEWRFNNRENPFLFRDTLLKLIGSKNLEYQELIAS